MFGSIRTSTAKEKKPEAKNIGSFCAAQCSVVQIRMCFLPLFEVKVVRRAVRIGLNLTGAKDDEISGFLYE